MTHCAVDPTAGRGATDDRRPPVEAAAAPDRRDPARPPADRRSHDDRRRAPLNPAAANTLQVERLRAGLACVPGQSMTRMTTIGARSRPLAACGRPSREATRRRRTTSRSTRASSQCRSTVNVCGPRCSRIICEWAQLRFDGAARGRGPQALSCRSRRGPRRRARPPRRRAPSGAAGRAGRGPAPARPPR